ncbi:hypothetical protein HPB52_021659 [Rhipicephalus sanguineus]|uniref:Tick transposon n=1 Tax=Rhipicephalus sanguineus TaxID=34632 RepID=A0A9D4T1V6_RHISA|nr:hypothetical protein HPB52_021659 [Rhipicephalus sanguineus]
MCPERGTRGRSLRATKRAPREVLRRKRNQRQRRSWLRVVCYGASHYAAHALGRAQRKIAEATGRTLKTVNRIVRAFKSCRRIKDTPRKPRSRVTTEQEGAWIVAAAAVKPGFSAKQIKNTLDLRASVKTVKTKKNGCSFVDSMRNVHLSSGSKSSSQTSARLLHRAISKPVFGALTTPEKVGKVRSLTGSPLEHGFPVAASSHLRLGEYTEAKLEVADLAPKF